MRMDQYIGLHPKAIAYLHRELKPIGATIQVDFEARTTSTEIQTLVTKSVYSQIGGAWQDVVANLHEYTWPSGEKCKEIVQATPWSSGPMYFLCLEYATEEGTKRLYEWTEQEMSQF